MTNNPTRVPFRRRLSVRQAQVAVAIAVLLGTLFAAVQVYLDASGERRRIQAHGDSISDYASLPAARAAYRLDRVGAQELVASLLTVPGLVRAEILDDLGEQLAAAERAPEAEERPFISMLLGAGPIKFERRLNLASTDIHVGKLLLHVDPITAAPGFARRTFGTILSGFLKSVLLSILLLIIYQHMITKRVSNLARKVAIESPDAEKEVEGDELDQLEVRIDQWSDTLRRNEKEALHREARLVNSQKLAQMGDYNWNIETGEISWSEGMYELLGYAPGKKIDIEFVRREILHPEDKGAYLQFLEDLIASTETNFRQHSHRLLKRDGEVIFVQTAGHIERRDGEATRLIGTTIDITYQTETAQALEEALSGAEQANNAKSVFLASMSHEMRTPLNAIIGYAEALEIGIGADDPTRRKEYLNSIASAGRQLNELLGDILDFSKIEAGAIDLYMEQVLPGEVINDNLRVIRDLVKENDLHFSYRSDTRDCILVDQSRLRQIVLNFVSNAVKYNRPGGLVELGCVSDVEGGVRIYVRDTGIGIPPDQVSDLFSDFARGKHHQVDIPGAGLGLSICKFLAEEMGGQIGCDTAFGEGSTFWVAFPAIRQGKELPATG